MRFFAASDVCRIADIHFSSLDRWVNAGWLQPANSGLGTGRHRVFSLTELVAVGVGVRYRAEGAGNDRVAGVVKFLAGLPIEHLEAHLERGETFVVPAALLGTAPRPACWLPGMLIKPPYDDPELTPQALALMRRLDLKRIYDDVQRKLAQGPKRRRAADRAS